MMTIDLLHDLLLPEYVVALFAAAAFLICVYTWFACNEYAALGYIFPLLYFVVVYYVFFTEPGIPDDWRRVIVRGGLVVLFIDITFQRVKFILIQRSKKRYDERNKSNS